jgi:BASS family bile acid:Na+ symporter
MQAGLIRTLALLLALGLGALLPSAHAAGWLIKWIVGAMLFVTFLSIRPGRGTLGAGHARLLAANVAMAFAAWGLGLAAGGREVGLAAFFAGLAPTAIAAPAVMGFLGGRVDFMAGAVVLSNVAVAALMPLLLPVVIGRLAEPVRFADVLSSVALVVFLPAGAAAAVRKIFPVTEQWPGRLRNVMFGLWAAAMLLAMANASFYLHAHAQELDRTVLVKIAIVTAAVCASNFALGRWLAGPGLEREGSQALGQKNTAFCIAMATAHASPLIALGPTCYVLWHNLWNSWQLQRAGRREASDAKKRI